MTEGPSLRRLWKAGFCRFGPFPVRKWLLIAAGRAFAGVVVGLVAAVGCIIVAGILLPFFCLASAFRGGRFLVAAFRRPK